MWCTVFLFLICCRSIIYSQGSNRSSAPEETLQHWLGLVILPWKPLKASLALLFWWNPISWKKVIQGSFFLSVTISNLSRLSDRNQGRRALLWGRSKCGAVFWSDPPATGPALYSQPRLAIGAKVGLCLRKTGWRTLSCCTVLGAQNVSWSSDAREMFVS